MKAGRSRQLYSAQKKSRYKNVNTWLDSVYKHNKEKIDAQIEQPMRMSKKEAFKASVREYHEEGYSWTKSLQKYEKSELFTTKGERLRANAMKALKEDSEVYREFREETKIHGKYTRIDYDKLEWDASSRSYTYDAREWDENKKMYVGNVVRISFSNSPKETIVEVIDEGLID